MGDRPAVHRPRRAETRRAPRRGAVGGEEGHQTPRRRSRPRPAPTRTCTRPARPGNAPGTPPNSPARCSGRKPRTPSKRYKELQDILGDLQDGVVAADLLRRVAAGTAQHPDENGFTYGLLYAQELGRAQNSRQQATTWADSL